MPQYFRYEKINFDIVEESVMKDWCALGGGEPPCTFFSICPSIPAKVSRHWQHRRSRHTFAVNSGNFLVPRSPGMRSLDVHPNYPYWENIIMPEDRLGKTSTKYPLSCRPTSSRAQGRTLRQIIIGENLYIRPLLCIRTRAQPFYDATEEEKKKWWRNYVIIILGVLDTNQI